MAFFTFVQGSVFVTSATNLPSSTPVQILEKGAQGPKGNSGGVLIVATPATLGTTPPAASLTDGMLAYVQSRRIYYSYQAAGVDAPDGTDIITANGGTGRWYATPTVPLQPGGAAGELLTSGGPGVNPSWQPPGAAATGFFPVVANPALLTGISGGALQNGMLAYVQSRLLHYKYDSASVDVVDGTDIISGAAGVGRWFSIPMVGLQPGGVAGDVLTSAGPGVNPTWTPPAGGPPSGAAGGDLAGTYPNPTVNKISGSGAPGYILVEPPFATNFYWNSAAVNPGWGHFQATAGAGSNRTDRSQAAFPTSAADSGSFVFMLGKPDVADSASLSEVKVGRTNIGDFVSFGLRPSTTSLGDNKIVVYDRLNFNVEWSGPVGSVSGNPAGTITLHAQDTDTANLGGDVILRSGTATTVSGTAGHIDFKPGNNGLTGGGHVRFYRNNTNLVFELDGDQGGGIGKMMFGPGSPNCGIGVQPATAGAGKVRDDRTQRAFPGSGGAGGSWNLVLGRTDGAGVPPTVMFSRETPGGVGDTNFTAFSLEPSATQGGISYLDVWEPGNFEILWGTDSTTGVTGDLVLRAQNNAGPAAGQGGHIELRAGTATPIGSLPGRIDLYTATSGDGTRGDVRILRDGQPFLQYEGSALGGLGRINFGSAAQCPQPGFGQFQASAGGGVARVERSQAAATGSNQIGGDFDIVIGAKDGLAPYPGMIRFGHENTATSNYHTSIGIRPSSTISSGTFIRGLNDNDLTIDYNTDNLSPLSATLTIQGQGNTNAAGTAGLVVVSGGAGSGGAIGGTVQLNIGAGAGGGTIQFATAGVPALNFQGYRFDYVSGASTIGTGQVQATGGNPGTSRVERTQAAAAGSALQGGVFDLVIGRADAGSATSEFRFGRESVAASTYFTGFDIRIGTTVNGDVDLFKEGTAGNLNVSHASLSTTVSGNTDISAQRGSGVVGGSVVLRPGSGTTDGDVQIKSYAGAEKFAYRGSSDTLHASVPQRGNAALSLPYRFGRSQVDCSAGGTVVLTAAQYENPVIEFINSPGAAFTVEFPANLGAVWFVHNETIRTASVRTPGGSTVNIPSTSERLIFCVVVGGVTNLVRVQQA